MVIWRRRLVESHVSEQIAVAKGRYVGTVTTEKDAIPLSKRKEEMFIEFKKKYYMNTRSSLAEHNLDYEVFEYGRDLKEPSQQLETLRRIKGNFDIPIKDGNITETVFLEGDTLKKQSQVPLSKQVENWQEVVEWGYGGKLEEWEDLFPGK
jgi:hypothetical protein